MLDSQQNACEKAVVSEHYPNPHGRLLGPCDALRYALAASRIICEFNGKSIKIFSGLSPSPEAFACIAHKRKGRVEEERLEPKIERSESTSRRFNNQNEARRQGELAAARMAQGLVQVASEDLDVEKGKVEAALVKPDQTASVWQKWKITIRGSS
jgi:hypothetical protein